MTWPTRYVNRDTGKPYAAHSDDELAALLADAPRYALVKGGEGAGKSVFGVQKSLDRLRRGMSGGMASPDFEHFKKSLWPEFRRWCPWRMVVDSQQRRAAKEWEPHAPFTMNFSNGTFLICGGMDEPTAWEGPNLNFFHLDEARRLKTAAALKVIDGRVRIPGPQGEPPQIWLTTTPRKNWLYEYFGPVQGDDDALKDFKTDSLVVTLLTEDNERAGNLEPGYSQKRRQSLNESEARVLLMAEWEDIDDVDRFLPSMTMWDACKETLPPLDKQTPIVVALDAGTHNDSFGLVAVSRHRKTDIAVRYVREWKPVNGSINFQGTEDNPGPELLLRLMCKNYNVQCATYDPYQMHDMATRLTAEGLTWFREFPQGGDRLESDKQLLDLITQRRLAHDGNTVLRGHIDNADRKPDPETRKLRIVKRAPSLKVDCAVALSMGAYVCLKLDL